MRRLGWVQRLAGTVKPAGSSGVGTSSTSLVLAWPLAFVFARPLPWLAAPFFWTSPLLPIAAGSPKGTKSGLMVSILVVVFVLLNRVYLPAHDHGLAYEARLAVFLLGPLLGVFRRSAPDLLPP